MDKANPAAAQSGTVTLSPPARVASAGRRSAVLRASGPEVEFLFQYTCVTAVKSFRWRSRIATRRLAAVSPDGRSKELHVAMVVHGRKVCLPRNPKCGDCCLADLCATGRKQNGGTDD